MLAREEKEEVLIHAEDEQKEKNGMGILSQCSEQNHIQPAL